MLEIGIATESKQQEVLDASLSIQKTVEAIQKATAKPATLIAVEGSGYVAATSSPSSVVDILAGTNNAGCLLGHTLVRPTSATDVYTNPYTNTKFTDVKLTSYTYNTSVTASRLYKDGIYVALVRGNNSSSSSSYNYEFQVYKIRGYNDKGLPTYEVLGKTGSIFATSGNYIKAAFFRKGNKIGVVCGNWADSSRLNNATYLYMYQFDLKTQGMVKGSVSLSGITGLTTTSTFYFPFPTVGTINDIDYGYIMYWGGQHSSYGKIKYRAEFIPENNQIVFTGKFEEYSTATESYASPYYSVSEFPATKVSYNAEEDSLTYSTIAERSMKLRYNNSGPVLSSYSYGITAEGEGGTLKPVLLDGVPYAFFKLKKGIAIYKLNEEKLMYEYITTLSTAMFEDANMCRVTFGPHHLGLVIQYNHGTTTYPAYDYSFVDYTQDLRNILGIGG